MRGLPDYHVHTFRCGHAGGASREFVERALELGLSEIGFTDHIPLYFLPPAERDPKLAMREDEFDGYVREVEALREEFAGRIAVRLGLEAEPLRDPEGRSETPEEAAMRALIEREVVTPEPDEAADRGHVQHPGHGRGRQDIQSDLQARLNAPDSAVGLEPVLAERLHALVGAAGGRGPDHRFERVTVA